MDWRALALSGLVTMGVVGLIILGNLYPKVIEQVLGVGLIYGFWIWTYKTFKKD